MISILLIGASLSMDALAISIANGLSLRPFRMRHALWMGVYFGFFQFLMPLLGFLLGNAVSGSVQAFGSYISFALLAFIGIKMIIDTVRSGDEKGLSTLTHKRLFATAVATSIDALAVGVSFAFMDIALVPSCLLIGVITFVFCVLGAVLGSRVRGLSAKKAGILGGLVLVGIGIKLLVEGFM